MSAGIIPTSSVPGWPNPPPGLMPACQQSLINAGISGTVFFGPQGLNTPDVANTQVVLNTYVGSSTELTDNKDVRKKALFDLVDNFYDLRALADGSTKTTLSGNSVANFLGNVGNNYRLKKNAINAATTVAAVKAVDINAGWPAYP
jgi:hypothetical protein